MTPSLRDLQRIMAGALQGRPGMSDAAAAVIRGDGVAAAGRLRVYQNNYRLNFDQALRVTFPVIEKRVGPEYFRQLAHGYRCAHASRHGDLHEIGRSFAVYLRGSLRDTGYAWLASLAELEWAIADAAVAPPTPPSPASALALLPPDSVALVRFGLAASVRLVSSSYPVVSVWHANQPGAGGCAIDLSVGPEHAVAHQGAGGVEVRLITNSEHLFLAHLRGGMSLGDAVDCAALPLSELPGVLHWMFQGGYVAEVLGAIS